MYIVREYEEIAADVEKEYTGCYLFADRSKAEADAIRRATRELGETEYAVYQITPLNKTVTTPPVIVTLEAIT